MNDKLTDIEIENLFKKLRGKFIVFDGPDGSGKTTQYRRFAHQASNLGIEICEVREPGGTSIGEQIRKILLNPENDDMDLRCEMLLYMASRAQLVADRIIPARQQGKLILADRFISSTLAYQGAAGGLEEGDILSAGKIALKNNWPNFVILLDVDEKTAATRLNPLLDRIEQKGSEYHRKVRQGFLEQAKNDKEHYLVVDSSQASEIVYKNILIKLSNHIK